MTQYGTTGSKDTTTPTYDAAGNTTAQTTTTTGSSPPPAPPAESGVTYNPFGLTATVTTSSGTSGYTYDASGNLLLQTDPATASAPASTTLYLDGGAEQITYTAATATTSADVVATRFYAGPDGSVISRTFDNNAPPATATTLTYLPGTPQGTATDSVTDDTSQVMTRRYYDPYGNQAGGSTSWPDNLGYLGRPADPATGLDLLGARQYEPATGRFLSLDPLFEPGTPQSMGGYAYAADNPATNTDPTGLCPCLTDGSTANRKLPQQPVQDHSDPGGGEHRRRLLGQHRLLRRHRARPPAPASCPRPPSKASRPSTRTTPPGTSAKPAPSSNSTPSPPTADGQPSTSPCAARP